MGHRLPLKKIIAVALAAIITVTFSVSLYVSNRGLCVTSYSLEYEKLPEAFDGFKIVQISDLHNAVFGENESKLLEKIQSMEPDLVAITGDIVTLTDTDFTRVLTLARELAQGCEVYYVPGNHELLMGENARAELYSGLVRAGVHMLDNCKATLIRGRECIEIYGLWFNLRYYGGSDESGEPYIFTGETAKLLLGEPSEKTFKLLLTHSPNYPEAYAEWGAELALCGHIHGGLVRLPIVGGIFSPDTGMFPKYDAGLFSADGMDMIVSRGLGNSLKGIRVFNTPELVEITLGRAATPTDL